MADITSFITAISFTDVLELVKSAVQDPEQQNYVINVIYRGCSPGPSYKPENVLYDSSVVQNIISEAKTMIRQGRSN